MDDRTIVFVADPTFGKKLDEKNTKLAYFLLCLFSILLIRVPTRMLPACTSMNKTNVAYVMAKISIITICVCLFGSLMSFTVVLGALNGHILQLEKAR